jgi:hypothetical protein
MKKMRFLPLMLVLGVLLFSCKKDETKEWKQFYDFTLEDIMGTYTYSNVSGAFNALTENDFCHICEDAVVDISPYFGSNTSIEFKVNCQKANFSKSFTGHPVLNDDNFLISISIIPPSSNYPDYEVTAYVYKNDKGNIRLHGFARHIYYENLVVDFDGTEHKDVKYMVNYYFDVIKN